MLGEEGGDGWFLPCFDGGAGGDGGEAIGQGLHHVFEGIGDEALFRVGEFFAACEANAEDESRTRWQGR